MTTHTHYTGTGRPPIAIRLDVHTSRRDPDVPAAIQVTTTRMLALPVTHIAVYAGGFVAMFAASLAVFLTR